MNDQLQAELTKIISNINSGSDTAIGFITGQTPEVIQQLLTWNVWDYGLYGLLWIIISVVSFIKFKHYYTLNKGEGDYIIMSSISGIIGFFFACAGIYNFTVSLKILIAPKIWLIEYIAELTKTAV